MIAIKAVDTKSQLKHFIDFPHFLYKNDPNYVPELFIAQRDMLTPAKHPFYKNAAIKLFLAYEDNVLKGRIAAILNKSHNEFNKVNDGFFGFFDCDDNQAVANALFHEAEMWLRKAGVSTIKGPVNPSTNDPCGLLIDGFGMPPVVMMTYNKPYYIQLIENYGFKKETDLYAWIVEKTSFNDRSVRLHQALLQRLNQKSITIRHLNMKEFKNEAGRIRELYNSAWDKNLGFFPMTDAEFDYLAKDLKMIVDPELCLIAEHEGTPIGFALAIPDINQVLIKIKRGRLFPTGIFKLLFGLKKTTRIRVLALGVIENYRKLGIEACFYASIIENGLRKGKTSCEASWILENNDMMNKGIEGINGELYKKYRLYEKGL